MEKEKEKIGKLLELLNEYLFGLGRKTIIESYRKDSLEDVCGTFRGIVEGKKDYPYTSIWGIEVISKKFGFIEWLVENDKINLYMLDSKAHNTDIIIELYKYENLKDKDSKRLLMLLAIQDEPINFLISILK